LKKKKKEKEKEKEKEEENRLQDMYDLRVRSGGS